VHARRIGLPILVENDPALYNIYHVMPVNSAKFPKGNASAGQAFADWGVSPEWQAPISELFKAPYGPSMFVAAASMREQDLLVSWRREMTAWGPARGITGLRLAGGSSTRCCCSSLATPRRGQSSASRS